MGKSTSHSGGNRSYIIAYDFSSDRLRRKVEKTLSDYGNRIQKSIFSFDINNETINKLRGKLKVILMEYETAIEVNDSLIIINNGGYDELKATEAKEEDYAIF